MDCGMSPCLDADAYQIIEIAVRKGLDIEENERPVHWDLQLSNDVYFFLADCKGSQRVAIFFRFGDEPLRASARPKRVGELMDGENAFLI